MSKKNDLLRRKLFNSVSPNTKSLNIKTNEKRAGQLIDVPLDKLQTNPYQPRFDTDESEIISLADSIKEQGLLQPIVVIETAEESYIIVAGHRRVEAHKFLGKKTIKAILSEGDDRFLRVAAIVENLQRKNLNPIEEALAIDDAIRSGAFENEVELAKSIGVNKSTINKKRSILKLPEEILIDVAKHRTVSDVSILRELLRLKNDNEKKEVYEWIKKDGPSRNEVKAEVNRRLSVEKRAGIKNISFKMDSYGKVNLKLEKEIDESKAKQLQKIIEDFLKKI